ncbi:unnamed protein product [Spirodela intermedia]|uniref:PPIase cyclophilin-type domain-containing protein n=1 Tax=Spirodela intermedia TaxID=51605 RepID=A0A7I8I818_SPIIN|nr:unnamed protein product [Spirodela intermedia]CAA6653797.1 unnamed protein product [Spirodela intermedia]
MGKIKPQALLQQSKKKKGPARISLSSIIACNFVVIVIGLSLYAAYKQWYRRGSRRSMKFELPTYAILSTPKGSITLELYKNAEPGVVDRFLSLCQDGHFRGAHFYHVINSYVLQVGKNQNSGSAKDWILKTKSDIQLGRQDFELYITVKPIPDSSDKFIVFGRVRRGEDVIQHPKLPGGISSISLKREGFSGIIIFLI